MTSRPLHAVLLPPQAAGPQLLEALAAAIDGSGPAILPLDPALPRARIDELIAAFAPTTLETAQDSQRLSRASRGGLAGPGVPEEVAVVLATSGSTGIPKGAELTGAALVASARASLARLGAAPGERWLCCLPTHHISGLGVLVRSLLAGSVPVLRDRVDAGVVARDASDTARCSYVSLVPTQLRRLLDAGAPLAGFRAILLGGAAIPRGMLAEAAAAGARVVTTYGMTETCGGCVYDGIPLDGVRVASGADGRIRISGPVLFSGYRLAPELTRTALQDGWFVTSDLGELTEAGRLVVRGRADDVIISGGEKIVAGEVEQVLRGCPQVRDAVVVGAPDPDWGERVTVMIVAADDAAPPSLDDLRAYVRDRLPRYAAPQAMVVVGELPMLTSGKPDRQLIRDMAAGRAS
ncbi:MAG TPA: AMP-binding protein [Streptosporangiaceae bacterium]|nr:AMP-binding protein [Streptosporangiaceae bacterium]